MAVGSEEGTIRVYAWPELECKVTVDGASGKAITDLAFSADGTQLLSVAAERATCGFSLLSLQARLRFCPAGSAGEDQRGCAGAASVTRRMHSTAQQRFRSGRCGCAWCRCAEGHRDTA
jgi:hypothetical protein